MNLNAISLNGRNCKLGVCVLNIPSGDRRGMLLTSTLIRCPFPLSSFLGTYLIAYLADNFFVIKSYKFIFLRFRPTINWLTMVWALPPLHINPLPFFLLICQGFFSNIDCYNYSTTLGLVLWHPTLFLRYNVRFHPLHLGMFSPFLAFDYKPLFIINCNGKKFS